MTYNRIKLVNARGMQESLSNIYDTYHTDCAAFEDAIYDARSLVEVAEKLNKLHLFGTMKFDRITIDWARYKYVDRMGNIKYLYLYGV